MKVTKLLLVRHGNTFAAGEVVRRVGVTDLPLVESGLQQGRLLGAYLQKQQLIPDVVFSSQLKRTRQTAEQLLSVVTPKLEIKSLAIFNEIDYGPDENLPEEQVVARIGDLALKEWESVAKVPPGWSVNPKQIIINWQEFAQEMQMNYTNKTILVVTSNGIARFAPYLTGNFPKFAAQHGIKIATGALCIFENRSGEPYWECKQWNFKPTKEMVYV
jgi:2,3-bisphosphoglycerate-dependent phosphoglycerate mutase